MLIIKNIGQKYNLFRKNTTQKLNVNSKNTTQIKRTKSYFIA